MAKLCLKQVSSLEKVLLRDDLADKADFSSFTALQGEKFSYQILYRSESVFRTWADVKLTSPLEPYITLYRVGHVPTEMPGYFENIDDDYISQEPGLFPDVLTPLEERRFMCYTRNTYGLWVDVDVPASLQPGEYPITVSFTSEEDTESVTFLLTVIGAQLPEQKTVYTQWFHTDCIAEYYRVPVFSEEYWRLVETYVRLAVDSGINMLLTPLFTPPLDTQVGGERTTVQLVDVVKTGDCYTFGFDKLRRWVEMCKNCGIRYFEMSHLFTQWGAAFTPKIMAEVDGKQQRIFGWDVAADSAQYRQFLASFIPELVQVIDQLGIREVTYFHISDEPHVSQLETYSAARGILKELLGDDFKIMDALSDYDFYERGLVEHPVVLTAHLQSFFDHGVQDLWTYTCCSPSKIYSNRFLAMPSGRNRVIGAQMYKFNIVGFLHWGMNFYHTEWSLKEIDPYAVTDGGFGFPGGDAFSVYPGRDGAIPSIRSRVFYDALQDMRAMTLLEGYMGKEQVNALLERYGIYTFADYTHDYSQLLALRGEINRLIAEYAGR